MTNLETINEQQLVKDFRNGDHAAFSKLYALYETKTRNMLYARFPGYLSAIGDWMQDAALKAFQNCASFNGDSSFYAWFSTIANHVALNAVKKGASESRTLNSFAEQRDNVSQLSEAEFSGACASAIRKEDRRTYRDAIVDALPKISDEHQRVFKMFYFEDMQPAAIAKELGISDGTVRSRLFYAKKTLASEILAGPARKYLDQIPLSASLFASFLKESS